MVPQSRNTGHFQANHPIEGLKQISLAILLERHPRVARAEPASISYYEPARIIHPHQLPPGPQGKVFTVSFSGFFELFWRLPIVFLAELLLVRNVGAFC